MYQIKTDQFILEFRDISFEDDDGKGSLGVWVENSGYKGLALMKTDFDELNHFTGKLKRLTNKTRKGKCSFHDYYGDRLQLIFSSVGSNKIKVSGKIKNVDHSIIYEKQCDRASVKLFADDLDQFCTQVNESYPNKLFPYGKAARFRKWKILFSALLLCATLVILSGWIFNRSTRSRVIENQFFSEHFLEEMHLPQMKKISENDSVLITGEGLYGTNIDSQADYDEYVSYVFDYLQNSPFISFVGFDIDKTEKDEAIGDKNLYIAASDDLRDYHIGYSSNMYIFYFLSDLDIKRNQGDKVNFKRILLDFHEYGTIRYRDVDYNFSMRIWQLDNDYNHYYFLNEYYDVNKIEINNESYRDYFSIGELHFDPDDVYFWLIADVYYAHSTVSMTFKMSYQDTEMVKTIAVEEPNELVSFYLSLGYSHGDITIEPLDVIPGYIWILTPKKGY